MKLLYYPDNTLLVPSKDVKNFADIPVLIQEMEKIMLAERGLGIAAPQCGHNLNLFLLKSKNQVIEIINPVIISSEGEQFLDEGCLSFKNLYTKIKRPYQIHFTYQDRNGMFKEGIVYEKEAQCFAHEFDHLQGRTILDYANRGEKKRILKELKKK